MSNKKYYFEDDDAVAEYNDSDEIKNKVFQVLIDWYEEYEAFSGEVIMQDDDCCD